MIGKADTALATALHPSPNFGVRRGIDKPNMLLLHYTGVEVAAAQHVWIGAGLAFRDSGYAAALRLPQDPVGDATVDLVSVE